MAGIRKKSIQQTLRFSDKLILNQWILKIFGFNSFAEFTSDMKSSHFEGIDEHGISGFYYFLTGKLFADGVLNRDILLQYDENIVRHTKELFQKRDQHINWKYFQYLSLLFTEIYLDWYFERKDELLHSLNEFVKIWNNDKKSADRVSEYEEKDLNKLAFWNATGSGKTLIMHINIKQYVHYLRKHRREKELNRIILLTPNEGLSKQHLEEFRLSGMNASLFDKDGMSVYSGHAIEIIDIHKLKDVSKNKTVAVDAFEGNNLVLVDEGHRGSSGEEWKEKRDKLCETGFSFEYSATFGQAIKAAGKQELEQEYAKCILFDYSYRYFYNDGYGKDYKILNLKDDTDLSVRKRYLAACLISFYQQMVLFRDKKDDFSKFLIENPLLIFVGGSVNAVRKENKRDVSDVLDVILFFSEFIKNRQESEEIISRLISGNTGVLDNKGRDIFAESFNYLCKKDLTGEEIFKDIMKSVFNSETTGGLLHVENLKNIEGEIALKISDGEPFGVINIGDVSPFMKLCDAQGLVTEEKEFSETLFHRINDKNSKITVLIGSKKFTEGWNSWRVSTMGLMNIGKKEGSQIIQLFGRGVRLKGLEFSLKRSRSILGISAPNYISILETLNIFGIRADYMQQFKEYLEDEGLPTNENTIEFVLPVIKDIDIKRLKIIKLKDNVDFKRDAPQPFLDDPPEEMVRNRVILNYYPKIQAMRSKGINTVEEKQVLSETKLKRHHIAFVNIDEIYFELERYKYEKSMFNINISRDSIRKLLENESWYRLYIPEEEMIFSNFQQVYKWQEISIILLKKYIEKFSLFKRNDYEKDKREYVTLSEYDEQLRKEGKKTNLIDEYRFSVEQTQTEFIEYLEELKAIINSGKLKEHKLSERFLPIMFDRHLYKPLIYMKSETVTVSPVELNDGERDFVLGLKAFYEKNKATFLNSELYLLRNQSKGRGIGFFEAGNFHPDFIMWLLKDGKQYISFIDPKGLRNMAPDDPKIEFHSYIKEIEAQLGDKNIILNSFILSYTPAYELEVLWKIKKRDLEKKNILFIYDDKKDEAYIRKMIEGII